MTDFIKLIWDFKGPDCAQTASHYLAHLQQYRQETGLEHHGSGTQSLSEFHAVAFLVIPGSKLDEIKKALLPHRGEYYTPA